VLASRLLSGVGGSVASAPNCEAESARAFSLFWFCRWRRLLGGSVFALMTLALPCLVCAQVQVDDGDGGTPRVGDSVAAAAAAASAAVSSSAPAVDAVPLCPHPVFWTPQLSCSSLSPLPRDAASGSVR